MPTDYRLSARVFLPKALLQKKLNNQKPTAILQFAIQEEQRNAECGARLKNFHPSNLLCICLSLVVTNVKKAKYSIYEKLSTVLASQVSVLRRNKATNFNPVADPEEMLAPPLIFRPNKNFFLETTPPPPHPYLRVWMTGPPLISRSGSGTATNPFSAATKTLFFGIW